MKHIKHMNNIGLFVMSVSSLMVLLLFEISPYINNKITYFGMIASILAAVVGGVIQFKSMKPNIKNKPGGVGKIPSEEL